MGRTRLLRGVCVFSLLLSTPNTWARPDKVDAGQNIRLSDRTPGLYLTPQANPEDVEALNFSTTREPLARLTPEEIQAFLNSAPQLEGYRVVIVGPPVRGKQAESYKTLAQEALRTAGIEAPVEVIRHPQGLVERLTNLLPRREDYEKPTRGELGIAAWKILVSEFLGFTVLLLPPVAQWQGWDLGPTLNTALEQIRFPMGMAVSLCVLDIAEMVPLVAWRRTLSNHNVRLSTFEKFLRQFVLGTAFAFSFKTVEGLPQIWERLSTLPAGEWATAAAQGVAGAAPSVIPAAVISMLCWTTLLSATSSWEQQGKNRRFAATVMEALTGMAIAPFYILTNLSVLPTEAHFWGMELNKGHFALMGAGALGAGAWGLLERSKILPETKRKLRQCTQILRQAGRYILYGKSAAQNGNGDNEAGERSEDAGEE